MRDTEVTALAQYEGRLLGERAGPVPRQLGAARASAPISSTGRCRAARSQTGEHFSLLIENNGPGGMYTEIARTIVLGKASNEVIDGFETVKEAQNHTLRPDEAGRLVPRHRRSARRVHARARPAARSCGSTATARATTWWSGR